MCVSERASERERVKEESRTHPVLSWCYLIVKAAAELAYISYLLPDAAYTHS